MKLKIDSSYDPKWNYQSSYEPKTHEVKKNENEEIKTDSSMGPPHGGI